MTARHQKIRQMRPKKPGGAGNDRSRLLFGHAVGESDLCLRYLERAFHKRATIINRKS
jgi:hypothetical protein